MCHITVLQWVFQQQALKYPHLLEKYAFTFSNSLTVLNFLILYPRAILLSIDISDTTLNAMGPSRRSPMLPYDDVPRRILIIPASWKLSFENKVVFSSRGWDCKQMIIFPPVKVGDLLKHSSTLLKYKYKVIHMLRCNLMFFVVCITFWLHWPTQQSTGLIPGLCMRLGLYFGEHSYFGVTPRRQSSILQPANFWRKQLPKISENICRNILR